MSVAMPDPPVYSRRQFFELAADFLSEHWNGQVPVDVEHIADVGMGIDIIDIPELERQFGINAYVAPSGKDIYVDRQLQERQSERYRFTLAHEIGHIVLHQPFLTAARYRNVDEYAAFKRAMNREIIRTLEKQANWFASAVLVPASAMSTHLPGAFDVIGKALGVTIDLKDEHHATLVAGALCRTFKVSHNMMITRGRETGHWNCRYSD